MPKYDERNWGWWKELGWKWKTNKRQLKSENNLHRHVNQRFSAADFKHVVGQFSNQLSPWIKVLVHAMAETHQLFLFRFHGLNETWNLIHASNFLQHLQHRFVRTSMQRSVEGGGWCSDCAKTINDTLKHPKEPVRIHQCRRHLAHCSRGVVELMISVENEKNIEGTCKFRVRVVLLVHQIVHHVQEIFSVGYVGLGEVKGTADAMSVGHGSYSWNLPQYSQVLLVADFLVLDVQIVSLCTMRRWSTQSWSHLIVARLMHLVDKKSRNER